MAVKLVYLRADAPDGGDGASDATAFNDQVSAVAACNTSESILYVRRGLVYGPAGTSPGGLYIAVKSPAGYMRVQPYGDEEMPPTFHSGTEMLPGDLGWSYVGDGLWKKAMSDNSGYIDPRTMRLYVGGSRVTGVAVNKSLGTGYNLGIARARYTTAKGATEAEVLAEVGVMGLIAPQIWMYTTGATGGNGILYVWTGSATIDPPTFYDGMTLVGANNLYDANGFGRVYGIGLYNASRVEVSGMDTIYAPSALRITGNTTNQDSTFLGCNAYAFGTQGVQFDCGSAGFTIRPKAINCVIDAKATLNEDWNFRDKNGVDWLNGSQDAAWIGKYTRDALFQGLEVIDGYHTNTYVGVTSGSTSTTENAQIVDHKAHQPNRRYGTLIGIAGLGVGQVATITRFNGYDAVAFISRTGSGQAVFNSCFFRDGKQPYPNYDRNSPLGNNLIPGIIVYSNPSVGLLESGCIQLNNCTIKDPYGWMLELIDSSPTPGEMPAGAFQATNTAFYDVRYINDVAARTYATGVYDKAGTSVSARSSAIVGTTVTTNCCWYGGAAGQPRVAISNAANSTFAAWTGLSGTLDERDQLLDSNGNYPESSPLYHGGAHTGYRRDIKGKHFWNPPSVGAYEYVRPRPLRTLP